MQNLPWHPHYDVWALIVTLVVFFEFTTNKELSQLQLKYQVQLLFEHIFLELGALCDYQTYQIK